MLNDEWKKLCKQKPKQLLKKDIGMHMVKAKMPLRPMAGFVFNGCEFFTATLCKINSAWLPSSSGRFHITK